MPAQQDPARLPSIQAFAGLITTHLMCYLVRVPEAGGLRNRKFGFVTYL
jgi:hypothetical protein